MRTEIKEVELQRKVNVEAIHHCYGVVDYIYTITLHSDEFLDLDALKVTHLKEVLIPEKLKECADLMGVEKDKALDLLWENYKQINK